MYDKLLTVVAKLRQDCLTSGLTSGKTYAYLK